MTATPNSAPHRTGLKLMKSSGAVIAWVLTIGILGFGALRYWQHSQYFPGSQGIHVSLVDLALWVGAVLAVGSALGLVFGGIGVAVAELQKRPSRPALKIGYLLGLNLTAVSMLWLLPAFI